jgi:uncharacterized protein (DUF305 family)
MKTMKKVLVTIALAAAFSPAAMVAAQETQPKHEPSARQQHAMQGMGHDMANTSEGSKQLHRIMQLGMDMPMPMTGDVDTDFATLMTMHHKQAIRMSEVLLEHGRNPELRALAQKMQASQREEIRKLAPYAKPKK